MRTGPFSKPEVITRLNASYVPVYTVNEDYTEQGNVSKEERLELHRIRRETLEMGKSSGTVHVYLLTPEGKVIDSMHVANAAKTKNLLEMMDRTSTSLATKPGKPLIEPTPQSVAPSSPTASLILHLTSRPLSGAGSWDGISENWIVYSADEVKQLFPKSNLTVGETWMPDTKLMERLLLHFYPVTENNDVTKNKIQEQSVTASVLSVAGGIVKVRLEGRLVMEHWFYHKPDGKTVDCTFAGYLEYEPKRRKIRTFQIATEQAKYGGGTFGVAVRSHP